MNTHPESLPGQTDAYEQFMRIHEDRWDDVIEAGIPLLERLVQGGETEKAEGVRSTLRSVRSQIENSGSIDQQTKTYLMDRITQGLQASRGY